MILFADDIILFASSKSSLLKIFLNKAHNCGIKNEVTFGISKCNTFVVKQKNFIYSRYYENHSFNSSMNHLPSTN
jgi:hypothetical protein